MTIFQHLLPTQLATATDDINVPTFLEGSYGTGKTTTGLARLQHLLHQGAWPEAILIFVPQRSLALPYLHLLHTMQGITPGQVQVQTLSGFARNMTDLFWPLIAEQAGFGSLDQPPVFLNLETSQFFLAEVVRPLIEKEGYFSELTMTSHRLYRQILDTLNKAAVVGFPHTEISKRLNTAYEGNPAQRSVHIQAQDCANQFRQICLQKNLMDFSLLIEVFRDHIVPLPLFQQVRNQTIQHLITDNLEEDTPVAHDLLLAWLPDLSSALFISDTPAGYRTFLGADPLSAQRIKEHCPRQVQFTRSLVCSEDLQALSARLGKALDRPYAKQSGTPSAAMAHHTTRFLPELLTWTARETARLIQEEEIPASEIVILAPFFPDTLRFSLQKELDRFAIPHRSRRPSRALREEPAALTLLTLTRLAHPDWKLPPPSPQDLVDALTGSIKDLDRMRATLLVSQAYKHNIRELLPFDRIPPAYRDRIGYRIGEQYEILRNWLADTRSNAEKELDVFFSLLFGEVLSQPGFGFHEPLDAARITNHLIRSMRLFRWTAGTLVRQERQDPGELFVQMVEEGLLGGMYQEPEQDEEAVLITPAFTYLMQNTPVDYQFWMSINSNDWWQRIYQPLTHPYVLSRNWNQQKVWTDNDEVFYGRETLFLLTQGLLARCRKQVYLGINEIGLRGFEDRGPLLKAFQQVLLETTREGAHG